MSGDILEFRIKRIKDVAFYVNENLYINDPGKQMQIELNPVLAHNVDDNTVAIIVRAFYHYDGTEPVPANTMLDIQVQNIFEIGGLRNYLNENNILVLPQQTIIALMSLSLSHTRALAAKNAAGTALQDFIMPVFNPEEAARFFFPYMFSDHGSVK
jgi:hypothetical protein